MKVFAVLFSALAVASALDVDWSKVYPRHVNPAILNTLPGAPSGRITGGQEAPKNAFPHQVGLFIDVPGGTAFCGGSLIDNEWVVTAAHCGDGAEGATVVLGGHYIRVESEEGRVEIKVPKGNIILHEKYDPSLIRNDIALIKIPAVQYTEKIQPIALPRKADYKNKFEGVAAIASGWGRPSDSQSTISDNLRFIDTSVMSQLSCKLGMMFIPTDDNICISGKNGKSTCNGDSGGPLTIKDNNGILTLVGATSFGLSSGCEKGNPAAFTRITSYMSWIIQNTGLPERD